MALPKPSEEIEGPVVASSAIRFLQYTGKYLHLMVLSAQIAPLIVIASVSGMCLRLSPLQVLLRPIAFEIFVGVTHLFQYYVYTIYSFFAQYDKDEADGNSNGLVSMVAAGTPPSRAAGMILVALSS